MSDPSTSGGTIHVDRLKAFSFAAQAFRVFDGGVEVGRVRNGKQISFEVAPGHHSIEVKARLAGTGKADVEVADGETVRLVCAPQGQRISVDVAEP